MAQSVFDMHGFEPVPPDPKSRPQNVFDMTAAVNTTEAAESVEPVDVPAKTASKPARGRTAPAPAAEEGTPQ